MTSIGSIILIGVLTVFSGCIQAVTGFGGGIVNMLFLPSFMPMVKASANSGFSTTPLSFSILWRNRQHVHFRKCVIPMIFYMGISIVCVRLSTMIPTGNLKAVFGGFLILMGFYFLIFNGKIKVSGGPVSGAVCGILAGILSSFFGIGGPPLVVYFLGVSETKEEYLGSINLVFTAGAAFLIILRIINGILTADMIPTLIAAVVGILIGSYIGGKIVGKINVEVMKKCIYIFLIFSGALTLINSLK